MSEIEPSDATPSPEPSASPPPSWVDRIAEPLQHAIGVIVGSNRKPPRLLKTLLNGTWLRHPLHSVATDVPVTAWILAAVFDIIWLVAPTTNAWASRAAEAAVLAGILGALGAIASGATDWSDTYGHERSIGLLHGTLQVTATLLYIISAILRFTLGATTGESVAAASIGFVGLVIVVTGAFFGGDLVYRLGVGVNHTAFEAAGEGFEPVMPLAEVEENHLYRVEVAGVGVLLVRTGEQLCAISATCPHAGGPLHEGTLVRGVVQCPWHGSRFRVCGGQVLTGPATVDAPRYDVRVRAGQVELKRAAN